MLKIALFGYLCSIHLFITGYLFYFFFLEKKIDSKINIFEFGFYGVILLSFISIFLNFFINMSKTTNDVIFLIPLIIFFLFFFRKDIFIKIIIYSIPAAILFTLIISFNTIYRPDAGLYHLPYVSIINENKIIIGINNLHFRFGHTSIIQYLSAVYNNHLFLDSGILIPIGLIYCNSIGYLIFEIFNKKNKNLVIIFFTLFVFAIFRMSNYGGFGNDAPAHFLFFYLICETLKNNEIFYKIKKTSLIATFIFLNKVTLLLCFFVPLFLMIRNFKFKNFLNKATIFSFIFLCIFLFKNFLVSGCLIFPVEQTCIKKTYWYDHDSKRNSNAINARLENEAWAKGWPDQISNKKNFNEYLSDFNWIHIWAKNHGKNTIIKISPFLIFVSLIFIAVFVYEFKNKNYKKNKERYHLNSDYFFLTLICIIGSILWFLKFPVFRYGYSYIACGLSLILFILFRNFIIFQNPEKLKKILTSIIFLLLLSITIKNIVRIYPNLLIKNKDEITPWPNIYSENQIGKKRENLAIYKNGQFLFYKSNKACHYSSSPCTHYFYNSDFTLDEINLKIIHTYKVFFFKRNSN